MCRLWFIRAAFFFMFETPKFRSNLLSPFIAAPFTIVPIKYRIRGINITFTDPVAHSNCDFLELISSKSVQFKAHLSFSEAAAASLYVLFTWFPHGTNCEVFIGRDACSQRESHRRKPITRRFMSDVVCYWVGRFMGTVGSFLSSNDDTEG